MAQQRWGEIKTDILVSHRHRSPEHKTSKLVIDAEKDAENE